MPGIAEALVPNFLADALVALGENTGLRWGPTSRELFWFRSPKENILEGLFWNLLVFLLIYLSRGYIRDAVRYPGRLYFSGEKRHAKTSPVAAEPDPVTPLEVYGRKTSLRSPTSTILAVTFTCCWISQVIFKSMRPNPLVQLGWVLMPCHIITLLWAFIFFRQHRKYYATNVLIGSILCSYFWGPVLAFVYPDWSDHQYRAEGAIFILHHTLLFITPLYYSVRYDMLPFSPRFFMLASWVPIHMNVAWYTPYCWLTGLNLNYQLHPPQGLIRSGVWVFTTPYYRLLAIPTLVILTVISYSIYLGLNRLIYGKKLRPMAPLKDATYVTSKYD